MRSQRPISQRSAAKRALAALRSCASGLRPEYSSPQPSQLTENDISDACVSTPSSSKSRSSKG